MPTKCPPPQAVELVDYLRSTGTGESKLKALLDLSCCCEGSADFLEGAKKLVGEGTMAKIVDFINSKEKVNPAKVTARVQESVAEANAEADKEAEGTSEEPVREEEKDSPAPKSPVADMNATEAIDHIGRMRSVEHLNEILAADSRVTVQRAATERIEKLTQSEEDSEDSE